MPVRGSGETGVVIFGNTDAEIRLDGVAGGIGTLPVSLRGKNVLAGDTPILSDSAGNLKAYLATLIAGEDQTNNRLLTTLFGTVTTNGDTALKATSGGRLQIAASSANAFNTSVSSPVLVKDSADVDRPLGTVPFLTTGNAGEAQRTPNVFKNIAAQAITAGTPVAVWSPSAKKYRFMKYAVSLSVAGSVVFKVGGVEFARTPLLAAGQPFSFDLGNGILATNASDVLQIDATVSGNVSGQLIGTEE